MSVQDLSGQIAAASILARRGARADDLLQVLIELQEACGWLPPDALAEVGRALRLPRAKIEAVASFYSFLSLAPRGKYRLLFSDNVTDRHAGSLALVEEFCRLLWVERGKVSEEGLVSVDLTSCTGMCDQAPALLVNGRAIANLDRARLGSIAQLIQEQVPVAAWPVEFFVIADNVRLRGPLLSRRDAPGEALRAALARGAEEALRDIERSGLRGRGGAGFRTAAKWAAARAASGSARYVVCNADEGEPGTFKDRVLLARHADHIVEGMTIAALVLGAKRGFIYLRGEYRYLKEAIEAMLARRRAAGLLGEGILGRAGFDFDIALHLGAGAYVCGEESALIESLEGKRGTPRNRPPYPVSEGYLGQPTVVNNVETFFAASWIALCGAQDWRRLGTEQSAGSKLLSISGDCDAPGVYEFPFGVTVSEVLAACGARDTQAVQVGGPAGTCIAAAEFTRRLCFEDLATAGAFMVFDASRDMFEVARNFTHFFAHESCGFCTPCRVGTSLLTHLMDKLSHGQGSPYDLREIEKLNQYLKALSHCGLGHSACHPVLDTMGRFRSAYEQRLAHRDYVPAFDLDRALGQARAMTGRDDPHAHLRASE